MADVKFSSRAYCKMMLHCAKYPHCAVNGILLAEATKGDSNITFTDAIPLFHICLHLSPMYEIALTQIDNMATSQGLIIAGYYLANENYKDISTEAGHKLADKIAENYPAACLVVIDNSRFPAVYDPVTDSALIISQHSDGKWKTKERSSVSVGQKTLAQTQDLLCSKTQELVDFDNHLDDIALDWKNLSLNEAIENA